MSSSIYELVKLLINIRPLGTLPIYPDFMQFIMQFLIYILHIHQVCTQTTADPSCSFIYLFIMYLFIHALFHLNFGSGFPPVCVCVFWRWCAVWVWVWLCVLPFDFPSWRFQFSFLCQTRYANIVPVPTATAVQTSVAFTVT